MKPTLLRLAAAALLLAAAGCELIGQSDDTRVVVTDGRDTSLETRQGNVVISMPADSTNSLLAR